ncbi:MAG: hypothetical protein NTX79_05945 [Candidatus Micrarchaeota archaeon]|nr:hypothetical protein [Candidatus Micrarchaeota archaeon]
MTICVAGICKFNLKSDPPEKFRDGIVFVTDHMLSLEGLGQFENPMKKYTVLPNGTYVMIASNGVSLSEIIDGLGVETNTSFRRTSEIIKEKMKQLRDSKLESQITSRLGFTLNEIKEIARGEIQSEEMRSIVQNCLENSLETEIMLVGFENGKAEISVISEFNIAPFRDYGFAAIGTGAMQAINALMFQQHSADENIFTALYNVYKAKRNAEVAEGVGRNMDIYILLDNGQPLPITNIELLNQIYLDELGFGKKDERLKQLLGVPTDVEKEENK